MNQQFCFFFGTLIEKPFKNKLRKCEKIEHVEKKGQAKKKTFHGKVQVISNKDEMCKFKFHLPANLNASLFT